MARYRLLRSDAITALIGGSRKKIAARLGRLYHAGYLDRPRAQIEYFVAGGGSRSIVYCAGPAARRLGVERDRMTHKVVGRVFLLHTLAIAAFRVALALAVRAHDAVELLESDEALASPSSLTTERDVRWSVGVAGDAAVAIVPDYVFALRYRDGRRRNYLVEIDRGTMPVTRSSPRQTSVMRKLCAYDALRSTRKLEHATGWRNFRVLIVTEDAARAGAIRRAVATSRLAASPLFVIGDQPSVLAGLFSA